MYKYTHNRTQHNTYTFAVRIGYSCHFEWKQIWTTQHNDKHRRFFTSFCWRVCLFVYLFRINIYLPFLSTFIVFIWSVLHISIIFPRSALLYLLICCRYSAIYISFYPVGVGVHFYAPIDIYPIHIVQPYLSISSYAFVCYWIIHLK